MTRLTCLLILVVACGSPAAKVPDAATGSDAGSGSGSGSGSGMTPDAGPDAAIDAPPADAGMAEGTHTHYVIDHMTLPTTHPEAPQDGLDLDGNGTIDNQLGSVLAPFASQGFDPQPAMTKAVDTGAIILLADLQTTSFTSATAAGFTTYSGTNPNPMPCTSPADTVCRQHLQGTGAFDAAATPRDPALIGAVTAGTFTGGPGHLPIQLALLGGQPLTLDLIGARVKLTATSTAITQGVIAGGVAQSDITGKLYPALQQTLTATVAADCTALTSPPGCGCTANSPGATVLGLFDTNHDCAISVDEVANNSLIQNLFQPDVMLEGQPALSLGFAITAVPATFTP